MKIAIGADHAGFELKEKLKDYMKDEGYHVVDVGPSEYDPGMTTHYMRLRSREWWAMGRLTGECWSVTLESV